MNAQARCFTGVGSRKISEKQTHQEDSDILCVAEKLKGPTKHFRKDI